MDAKMMIQKVRNAFAKMLDEMERDADESSDGMTYPERTLDGRRIMTGIAGPWAYRGTQGGAVDGGKPDPATSIAEKIAAQWNRGR